MNLAGYMPWRCEACHHEWREGILTTPCSCPTCESEVIYHGQMVMDRDPHVFDEYD